MLAHEENADALARDRATDCCSTRRAHLVGVAGAGMRALADVLLGWGWQVSGSDLALGDLDACPRPLIRLHPGHAVENVPPRADVVVYSDAVPAENVEIRRASVLGIPALSYFQMLGRLMAMRRGLAVAGTHGKSTTTAMAAHVLAAAGRDPTVVCGATPLGRASGGRAGLGDLMLVEACEYRANFLHLRPEHAVILNIEPDHFDCYPCVDDLHRAFTSFARQVGSAHGPLSLRERPRTWCPRVRGTTESRDCAKSPPDHDLPDPNVGGTLRVPQVGTRSVPDTFPRGYSSAAPDAILPHPGPLPEGEGECGPGLLLISSDCPVTKRLTAGLACCVETFGLERRADWSARALRSCQGRYEFEVWGCGRHISDVWLQVPGRHNVLNALAAAALTWHNGVTPEQIAAGLGSFRGLRRRLEVLGTWGGVTLVDDYAHHPTEITATLRAVRELFPGRRLWCVFQPHQASRTAKLMASLASALRRADVVLVAEIFRAREGPPRNGEVTAADLARRIPAAANIHSIDRIVDLLQCRLLPGDVLVTMGAGDIREVCDGLLDRFREDRAAG